MSSDLSQFFGQGFDPMSVEPAGDFDVLPAGEYPVIIDRAEVCETRKGNGHLIKLQMSVLDGPSKGRVLFDNIKDPLQMNNLVNRPKHKALQDEMEQKLTKLLARAKDPADTTAGAVKPVRSLPLRRRSGRNGPGSRDAGPSEVVSCAAGC